MRRPRVAGCSHDGSDTKLFVFHERGDSNIHPSKARFGERYIRYIWGENQELFDRLGELRFARRSTCDQTDHLGARTGPIRINP